MGGERWGGYDQDTQCVHACACACVYIHETVKEQK